MKKRNFMKQIIGAICAGVLISMPMTVKAVEKSDIVGDWTGNPSVSFYEDGMAEDDYNSRPYHMESGSIIVKYGTSGNSDTITYDLWRGEEIGDSARDGADATIYQIVEPGKMKVWNIYKNNGEWISFEPGYLYKKTNSGSAGAASSASQAIVSKGCEHVYEWSITTEPTETADGESTYRCKICGDIKARQPVSANTAICQNLLTSIRNAEAGTTVTFQNPSWKCYSQYILDALKKKSDVSLKTDFTYQGTKYSFTIPAGSDYTNLEKADFYGFMYLYGAFNGTVIE